MPRAPKSSPRSDDVPSPSKEDLERLVAGDPNLRLLSYDILFDPVPHPSEQALDRLLTLDQKERLFDQVHDEPREAIAAIEPLLDRVPDSPILLNWLSSSYQKVGDVENARQIARRNYERNPDYLFAKVGHAHFLLLENDLIGFEKVFDGKYDLKLLYPERTAFHVSEFVSLYGVVIEYLIRTKDLERAELLYDSMAQVAPDAGMTKWIHNLLLNATMLRIMERMEERLRKPRKPRKQRAKKPPSSSPPPPPPA